MRIRSIKPEFWTSEAIARLPRSARLTFIGLWSYVDDNGVGRDNERLILADIFPLEEDPREALASLREDLATLSREGRIVRYRSGGKSWLAVNGFGEHQRIDKPAKPRYPTPDQADEPLTCENTDPRDTLATPSRQSRETPAPGAVEQWSSGAVEQGLLVPAPPRRDDVEAICSAMADHAERLTQKRPRATEAWRTQARLLIDRDDRTLEQVLWMIDWVTKDPFWSTNVLSVPKLREQFDQLVAKSRRPALASVQTSQEGILQRAMARAQEQERGA